MFHMGLEAGEIGALTRSLLVVPFGPRGHVLRACGHRPCVLSGPPSMVGFHYCKSLSFKGLLSWLPILSNQNHGKPKTYTPCSATLLFSEWTLFFTHNKSA